MNVDRRGLADFLRSRRLALQPEDVGLPRGQRRRTPGLRREEVAALCSMSVDYYARLERERGPQPSEQMIAAIAQGLHLSLGERDHLFRLAGHTPPGHGIMSEHIAPGMLRIFDRLQDTPAEIVTELGETLRQTSLGMALAGDLTAYQGFERSIIYRWFSRPESRGLYAPGDQPFLSRLWVSGLREVATLRGPKSRASEMADSLLRHNDEFREIWSAHEVGLRPPGTKHFMHSELGELELNCQTLLDPDGFHSLLVYTAIPGSESAEKLRLLSVVGTQMMGGEQSPRS
ncbi:MAG: helix-turn-helix transcriptional regulator [Pseudoclavibacter sp.]